MTLKIYQFAEPGQEASGPLPLGRLAEMMHKGDLSREVMVLDDGEWKPLLDLLPPEQLRVKIRDVVLEPEVPKEPPRRGLASVISAFGIYEIAAGVLLLIGCVFMLATKGDWTWPLMLGLAAIFSGVMTLAAAEVLDRLREIRDELRRR